MRKRGPRAGTKQLAAGLTPERQIRFWANVARRGAEACWPWRGSARTSMGYGSFFIGPKGAPRASRPAHVVAWVVTFGEPSDGMCVLHRCDNPRCVNPAHLFLGTPLDNVRDRQAKGRQARQRGSRCGTAKLKAAQVRAIRASRTTQATLAARYGVSQALISKIRRRVVWAHLKDAR